MPHGIDAYFHELTSHQRRVAIIGGAVAIVALVAEVLAMRPAIVQSLNDPKRFGFEGEEQYVRRILLETMAEVEQPGPQSQNFVPIEARRGGGTGDGPAAKRSADSPAPERRGPGAGEDPNDLQSRLRALALQGPIIRS